VWNAVECYEAIDAAVVVAGASLVVTTVGATLVVAAVPQFVDPVGGPVGSAFLVAGGVELIAAGAFGFSQVPGVLGGRPAFR